MMIKNRIVKYALLVYGVVAVGIVFAASKLYISFSPVAGLSASKSTLYESFFLLVTGGIALILASYEFLTRAFQKGAEPIRQPQ